MTVQTILTVTAWVFAVIALSVSIGARNKEKENEVWSNLRTKSLFDKVEKARENDRSDYFRLVRRIESLEKKLSGEGRDACRPRSYVTLGEGDEKILVLLPERKKELFKEDFKPHKVDGSCVGCDNLITIGGKATVCSLDLRIKRGHKCKDYEVEEK